MPRMIGNPKLEALLDAAEVLMHGLGVEALVLGRVDNSTLGRRL